ncbi:c-type cytochrome [Brumimicrobium aurantiacum]|nr:cytochrome c [Brumimicrobium aurantiacum]
MLKLKPSDLNLEVLEMLTFFYSVYLKFMPNPQQLVLILYDFYGGSRQMYRHYSLEKHQELVAVHTDNFAKLSKKARENPVDESNELLVDESLGEYAKGAAIFSQYCTACHKEKEVLVGPPIAEMAEIYINNETALIDWIREPGKKREDFPQMPGFPQLSDEELQELSKYIIK